MISTAKLYVVEHLDPELGPWSRLEYLSIAEESYAPGSGFCLSSVPATLELPRELQEAPGLHVETEGVETFLAGGKGRVCLLDPSAARDLSPEDGDLFDVFLFGGILGDDPPRDRTSELRNKGFEGRRLGPKQMTTDTAVRVTRMVIQDEKPLAEIPYIDFPELRINKHESTEIPFRYVKGKDGEPVMPQGMLELIRKDSEKGFDNVNSHLNTLSLRTCSAEFLRYLIEHPSTRFRPVVPSILEHTRRTASESGGCGIGGNFKTRLASLRLGVKAPTSFALTGASFGRWLGIEGEKRNAGNVIAILALGWSYILSICLTEMQGQEGAEIVYTNAMAARYRHDGKDVCSATVPVDIGDVDEGATWWWAALLAPGQGWKAILSRRNNEEYLSP